MHNLKIDLHEYASYKEYIQILDILEILGWEDYFNHFVGNGDEIVEGYVMLVHRDTDEDIWSKTNKILDILRR